MSDVMEQGATRWARPIDYGGPTPNWNGAGDRTRPSGLPEPKYPRNPSPAPGKRVPGVTPKWSPISPNPLRPKPIPAMPGGRGLAPIPAGRLPGGLGGSLGRIIPGIGIGLGLAGMLDDFLRPPSWYPVPNPANGWIFAGRCNLGNQGYYSSSTTKWAANSLCIGGQALSGTTHPPVLPHPTARRWSVWTHPNLPAPGVYCRHVEQWYRDLPISNPASPGLVRATPMPNPVPNPNDARGMPTMRPGTHPLAGPAPHPQPKPSADPGADGSTTGGSSSGGSGRSVTPDGVRPIPPRPRVPPRPRERETKSMTGSKRILIALFKVLDEVSEHADTVDSLFESLPKEVRDKWKCNRREFGVDVAGQYGISNADCKAKALWHNWHKLDPEQAVENIIKNGIYDSVLGRIHRTLPRNTGGALDDAFRSFDDFFSNFLNGVVDF